MASFLPITLSGDTLGHRHRYLNAQVHSAASSQVSFEHIEAWPEQTPVDRLFKIQLAIQLKNVDYILKNIKDDDLLYVSKALKCRWLLERRDIVNPEYLENVLFPEMVMPAISKMKHWLYINVTDSIMCQEFYEHYKQTDFHFAVKFLNRCSDEFVLNELPKITRKITPHYLKVFAEKNPQLVKLYYDSLATDNELVKVYLKDEQQFYNNIKCVLKSDPTVFLDITEKYHPLSTSNKLSPSATEYIVRCHKSRFMAKLELYLVYLLHLPTVAKLLRVEECQDLVIKIARADYLSWWFSYQSVEPLVKRVSRDERAAFKKRVFVEKDVGEQVKECQYELPASPVASYASSEDHVFQDQEYKPIWMEGEISFRKMLKKRKMKRFCKTVRGSCRTITELQKLFDKFRFIGFESTLHELRGRIGAVSSADMRRDMLLVLVSKSGGRAESVRALLELALRLRNEPVHERAAVVRSLVKRASAWRLPQDVWDTMLEYAQGLGLDGSKPEAICREGLHAVVIRQFIDDGECELKLRTTFLEDFSTLLEYKLSVTERKKVAAGLQRTLMAACIETEATEAASHLNSLLDVLEQYHISVRLSPVLSAVLTLAETDLEAVRQLLHRLYNAGVGRRELLCQYLTFRHDNAALVNALRHDPNAITPEWLIQQLIDGTQANQFLMKLGLYFIEKGGKAEQVRHVLQDKITENRHVQLARSLAILSGRNLEYIWREQDALEDDHYKLAAALRAHMHRARPAPDALALGWREAGMKAVASRAVRCRLGQVTHLVQTLLMGRDKRTVRLVLMLAQRTNSTVDIFSTAVSIRPLAALRGALLYYRKLGHAADLKVWDIVKPVLSKIDLKTCRGVHNTLKKCMKWVPEAIKPEYCANLYLAIERMSPTADDLDHIRLHLMKCLHRVDAEIVEHIIMRMMENIDKDKLNSISFPAIVIRYLMLSTDVNEYESRFKKIGEQFFNKVDHFRDENDIPRQNFFNDNLEQIMASLQYNFAFFDIKYQCCLQVIERVLSWMGQFLPREKYFEKYVKIHLTMLYYKAVRQSIKHKPEIFKDCTKKLSEGVDVIGFTFGRYIVKELAELKNKYFDSVVDLYSMALEQYLNGYFTHMTRRTEFVTAILKGILSQGKGSESRLAVHVLQYCSYNLQNTVRKDIQQLIMKSEDKQVQFFVHANF